MKATFTKRAAVTLLSVAAAIVLAAIAAVSFVFAAYSGKRSAAVAVTETSVQTADATPPESDTPEEYSAENFTELPSDFEQVQGSDTGKTRTAFFDGEMFVYHDNTAGNAANYFGAAYEIAKDREYGDFEFEMTFRTVQWNNASRFFAVMFHTQRQDGRLVGYMVNYRVSGQTAVSALSKTPAANDIHVLNPHKPSLDDKGKHTIKIRLVGTECSYYMDDALCTTWQTTEEDAHLGGAIERGGFALLVNQQQIAVSSVKISPLTNGTELPMTEDNLIVNTYYEQTGIINAPTVVCDVTDSATLAALEKDDVLPSNAILHVNDALCVTDGDGKTLGAFFDVYAALRGRVVPVVRVESEQAADAFIDYMKNTLDILDISVLSSDAELVKKVRTALPRIRGMIAFDEISSPAAAVACLQKNRATVAVLPQELADTRTVTYIQARFKTVWAVAQSNLSADIRECINGGAYGVVSADYKDVYDVLRTYPQNSKTRTAMNVAHRGCGCDTFETYENSLGAVRMAVKSGATHLELDGKLTVDGHIVILHDDSITATTNGFGNAESMTLAKLREYNLTIRDNNKDEYLKDESGNDIIEKIPTLEEVLDEIKDTDIILVFEVKTNKTEIIDVLKSVLDKYDMHDRVIAICFDDSGKMFAKINEVLPEMPSARLEGLGGSPLGMSDFAQILTMLGTDNAAYDKSYSHGGASAELNRYLRDRGMVGWYWTFAKQSDVEVGESLGYLGLTNNCAEVYRDVVRTVVGVSQSKSALAVGDAVEVEITTYGGATQKAEGVVGSLRRFSGGWYVTAEYTDAQGRVLHTQNFKVSKRLNA